MKDVVFEKYCGSEEEVTVDASQNREEYTAIAAKAFLSCKSIKKLKVGSAVAAIGDWAFAYMQNLEQLILPCREILFGKKVFLSCSKLQRIDITGDCSANPGTPFLLAAAVRILQQESLCRPEKAGDAIQHGEWIMAYDKALLSFLEESDEKGFEPVFFGWFKVDDIEDQRPGFLEKRRTEKAQLVLQRLAYPMYLQEAVREQLYCYIREHVPNGEMQEEHVAVYMLFCGEESCYAKEVKYMQILKDSGCLTDELIDKLLENIKEKNPEVTAFLLRQKLSEHKEDDYFSGFCFEI